MKTKGKTDKKEEQKIISEDQLIRARKETLNNLKTNMDTLTKEIQKTEQLRTQFLSNVSHEIKTPLNSILSATELLHQKQLDPESKELVETIQHSGQYLYTLLNDVLDYYKINLHQLNLDHVNFKLKTEVEEIFAVFGEKAREKALNMGIHFNEHLPEFLTGDAVRLKQILAKLLENAIKFTPARGKVFLTVTPLSFQNGKYEIQFSVRDTGIGIKPEDQQKIWGTFNMADMSLTRNHGGAGFGLALSRQLCRLLGGDMNLKSEFGKGSTFTFTIKMSEGYPPRKSSKNKHNILDILLVEDNLVNQKLTQKILIKQGFHVDVADNGKIAVDKFIQHHYDLIFMDIQMPVMDGLEATRQIRKLEGNTKDRVKIIALTANSQKQDKEDCLAAGMDDYINKPFNVKKFPIILNSLQE